MNQETFLAGNLPKLRTQICATTPRVVERLYAKAIHGEIGALKNAGVVGLTGFRLLQRPPSAFLPASQSFSVDLRSSQVNQAIAIVAEAKNRPLRSR